jgi:nitrite reductase/ring-hydroxylating ferredoxin subunit
MHRRELLEWLTRSMSAGLTLMVGIPGMRYLLDGFQVSSTTESEFTRLIRLGDLRPGCPTLVPVIGQKQDAWVRHEQQTVGRVWLVRDSESAQSVRALSSVCPHMGCQLQKTNGNNGFVCPCHRASFGVNGTRRPDGKTGERNHAPRDLDELECRVVHDEGSDEHWIEVRYQRFETGREQRIVRG